MAQLVWGDVFEPGETGGAVEFGADRLLPEPPSVVGEEKLGRATVARVWQRPAVRSGVSTLTTTPTTLVAGTIAAGSALNLQVSLTLPDQNETTTNGTVPVGTIQGLTAALTWTFTESQRTATTTGS